MYPRLGGKELGGKEHIITKAGGKKPPPGLQLGTFERHYHLKPRPFSNSLEFECSIVEGDFELLISLMPPAKSEITGMGLGTSGVRSFW